MFFTINVLDAPNQEGETIIITTSIQVNSIIDCALGFRDLSALSLKYFIHPFVAMDLPPLSKNRAPVLSAQKLH